MTAATQAVPASAPRLGALSPIAIAALFGLLAAAIQSLAVPIDADVSWLITVAEKLLEGRRLYVDIFEVNPPASVWLYVPPVWLSQMVGIRPEAGVAAMTIAAALASIAATLRLTELLEKRLDPRLLAAGASFFLLVYPGGLFAQREHFALILSLPVLASLAVIAEKRSLSGRSRAALGAVAGVVIVLKPHFLLAILPAALWAAWKARAVRPLIPGIASGALILSLYAAAVLVFASAYFGYIPVLRATYLPMREEWLRLLISPVVFVPAGVLVLTYLLRPAHWPALAITLLLGAAGFALAGAVQGKGYGNHGLPGSVLALFALGVLLASGGGARDRRRLATAVAAVLVAGQLTLSYSIKPPPGLADALQRVAPARPSVITLGTELVTGHPAVRNVDGRWAGSRASLFITAGVQNSRRLPQTPEDLADLERWYRADLQSFAEDVANSRPDVVLVERGEKHWIGGEPVLVHAMRDYRFAERAGTIEVWIRRSSSR